MPLRRSIDYILNKRAGYSAQVIQHNTRDTELRQHRKNVLSGKKADDKRLDRREMGQSLYQSRFKNPMVFLLSALMIVTIFLVSKLSTITDF
mmetsp:Transcript_55642/g.166724  ORF Transcript_55642/g.166724 Transcript_55642/m.166724 type:complete len:92 (-) Transcript_55642:47-322(-)